MSTTLAPESTMEANPTPGPGTKTLCVKNVPYAVWQRARQNALASNLRFGDYLVKLLGTAGPFPPPARSAWEALTEAGSTNKGTQPQVLEPHASPHTTSDGLKGSE